MNRAGRLFSLTSGVLLLALGVASCDDSSVEPQRPTKTLSIVGGSGSGRVTSNDGKIDCQVSDGVAYGPRCTATVDSGTVTTLTAVADAGQQLLAWSGDCSGKTCQLTVTRDMSAGPRFVGPQATLTIELVTPNADDGGILFDIGGPSILGIIPAPGIDLVDSRNAGAATTSRIVARGNLISGPIAQVTVRGTNIDDPYQAQVLQVAARASAGYKQRSDLSGYRITVRK